MNEMDMDFEYEDEDNLSLIHLPKQTLENDINNTEVQPWVTENDMEKTFEMTFDEIVVNAPNQNENTAEEEEQTPNIHSC